MIQGIGEEIILCLVLAERVHKSNFPQKFEVHDVKTCLSYLYVAYRGVNTAFIVDSLLLSLRGHTYHLQGHTIKQSSDAHHKIPYIFSHDLFFFLISNRLATS